MNKILLKEFCLEDKRKYGCIYEEQDIKQAVKLLKEKINKGEKLGFLNKSANKDIQYIINKIFGESLSK